MGISESIQHLIGTSPYRLVYGKSCHLPVELVHKTYWVTRKLSMDFEAIGEKRLSQLHELERTAFETLFWGCN